MIGLPVTRRAALRLGGILSVVLLSVGATVIFAVAGEGSGPQVTTDKPDYYSNETVIIAGTGFAPNTHYDVPVLRPDGSYVKGDGLFQPGWDSVLTNGSGDFTYHYQLDGIAGTYGVAVYAWPWGGPGSPEVPLANTAFTDADIDFTQCINKSPGPDCYWGTGGINAINSTYYEGDSVPQRLFHKVSNVGSHTMLFSYEFSKASVYAYDFISNVDQTLGSNLDPCDGLPGFVPTATCNGLYAATALVPVPSDAFDLVSTRENPSGRSFRVACTPACTDLSVNIAGHDPSTTCFRDCGDSVAQIKLNFKTASPNTLVGVWFAGHLAEAADPDGAGPAEGWGTGCGGPESCGSSAVSGAPFHFKYISLDAGSVGNRDNQIQSGGVLPPPPPSATLIVIKHVINDNGGTAVAANFTIRVAGNTPSPASFPGAESPGTSVDLYAGAYSLSESGPPGYSARFSADCIGSVAAGETKTCTITNDDIPSTGTPTPTPSATPSSTPSPTPSSTPTDPPTITPTPTVTDPPTITPTPTVTDPPVGGMTELHVGSDGRAAHPADGSSTGGALYAAIAAALVAITACTWYARRRWLRRRA